MFQGCALRDGEPTLTLHAGDEERFTLAVYHLEFVEVVVAVAPFETSDEVVSTGCECAERKRKKAKSAPNAETMIAMVM